MANGGTLVYGCSVLMGRLPEVGTSMLSWRMCVDQGDEGKLNRERGAGKRHGVFKDLSMEEKDKGFVEETRADYSVSNKQVNNRVRIMVSMAARFDF